MVNDADGYLPICMVVTLPNGTTMREAEDIERRMIANGYEVHAAEEYEPKYGKPVFYIP